MHTLADAAAAPIFAHGLAAAAAAHWDLDPLVIVPLAITAALYACGVARVWRRAGWGRGMPVWSAVSFAAGWTVLLVALVTPVAWLSQILFSMHMTQHMLLMLIAAPLLTFGQPLLVWMWALDDSWRERTAHAVRRRPVVRGWHALTSPLSVFLIQAAALWLWHIPSWYQAALRNDGIHALEHLCLVLSASLFWWAMVRGRYGRIGYGLAVVYIFLTAVHSSVLGALLTVSDVVWYPHYGRAALAWQVDSLADQQLAGLLMWVPAGVIFIVFGLALFAAWLGEAERRVRYGLSDATARRLLLLLFVAGSCAASNCGGAATAEAEAVTGGNASAGQAAIGKYGCGSCHTIPGIRAANATVGPPLDRIARRHYLGGHLTNTPDNMIKWIQHPQVIDPKNAMPELGLGDQDARDIAAFLYTLR
jgi:cytochrome c oxidase assembly factor CtaG/cytochrome c2